MKTPHATILALLLIAGAHVARADTVPGPTFLKLGSTYSLVVPKDLLAGPHLNAESLRRVKILERGGDAWFKVEYTYRWKNPRRGAPPTHIPPNSEEAMKHGWQERTVTKWLNFDFVLAVTDIESEK